ncbi:hypothetical protein [Arthrobacter koreensis]|uniref:hypothetical protein n=1 Tax=Arthrobacter koreensis TaxID=199136 RepID=UPI00381AE609
MSTTTINAPMTTEQAIDRARRVIEQGKKLTEAADAVTEMRSTDAVRAAEAVKEVRLLDYRVMTIPSTLAPVLEVLIAAAAKP